MSGVSGQARIVEASAVDTNTGQLEHFVDMAVAEAEALGVPLALVLEDWGAGGVMGIKQWIGLGEKRGPWRRAFIMAARHSKSVSKGRVVMIHQGTWRGMMIGETGVLHPAMGWRAFESDEWKEAAQRWVRHHFDIPEDQVYEADTCEAILIGLYAMRSDELGKKLPKGHLANHGMGYPPPDNL